LHWARLDIGVRVADDAVMELWLHAFAIPGRVAERARQAQAWGFAGLRLADSQNLTADIWVELGIAASVTSDLRLGPGVTNPGTRHLAVTASAAATLQAETDGRAVLGFARGDSALSQVGLSAPSVGEFEQQLLSLQRYLRGDTVRTEGTENAIHWLAGSGLAKVPVHVAATGPRVIRAAAPHIEGIDLTVGAELERVRVGVATVREATPSDVSVGAYVNVAVDPGRARARDLVRGSVATFARFAVNASTAGLSDVTRGGIKRLADGYERDRHGSAASPHARLLEDDFIDRFAVAGPVEEVRERLLALADAGIERLIVVPGSLDADPDALRRSDELFAERVLPELV
jgi:5,10-methylenetetrahydromethanopterin reductase